MCFQIVESYIDSIESAMTKNVSCEYSIMVLTNIAEKQILLLRNRGNDYFESIPSRDNLHHLVLVIKLLKQIAFIDEVE